MGASNWVPWGQAGCHGFPRRRVWGSGGSRGTSVGFDGVEGDVKGSLRRVGGPSGLTGTSVVSWVPVCKGVCQRLPTGSGRRVGGPRGSRGTSGAPKLGSRGTSRVHRGQGDVRLGPGVKGDFKGVPGDGCVGSGVPGRLDGSSDNLFATFANLRKKCINSLKWD